MAFASRAREFLVEHFQNGVAVEQAGETVVSGLLAQGFARRQELLLQFQNAAAGAEAKHAVRELETAWSVVVSAGFHASTKS